MTESVLKSALVRLLRQELPGAVVLSHTGAMTAGIPDISVTWFGRTSWWEVKYAHPVAASRGSQDLTMLRLGAAGTAFYIIYEEKRGVKRVGIVHPRAYESHLDDGDWSTGFNHRFVVEHIRRTHAIGEPKGVVHA